MTLFSHPLHKVYTRNLSTVTRISYFTQYHGAANLLLSFSSSQNKEPSFRKCRGGRAMLHQVVLIGIDTSMQYAKSI